MVRLFASAVIAIIGDAIALLVASWVLDDMSFTGAGGYVVAVLIFAGVEVLALPLTRQIAIKQAPALLGSTALITTFVALIVTTILTDGMSISGTGAWFLAPVVVWLVSLAARLLLPLVIFKKVMAEARGSSTPG